MASLPGRRIRMSVFTIPPQAERPSLRPETIQTYELAYEHYFNSTYRLSLSAVLVSHRLG